MADSQIKVSRINLTAKMDDLTNNEVLGLAEDFYCNYLQNADLFYEKSLAIRPGTEDLCGGFVWGNYSTVKLVDTLSGIGYMGTGSGYRPLAPLATGTVIPNTIYIPEAATTLLSGTMFVRGVETTSSLATLGAEAYSDIDIQVWAFSLTQQPLRSSGMSFFQNAGGSAIRNIGISGAFINSAPYPTHVSQTLPVPSGSVPIGVANARVNLGLYSNSLSGNLYTDQVSVPFKFNAPVYINSGSVYTLRYTYALSSGTTDRGVEYYYIQNSGTDWSKNTKLMQENSDGVSKYIIEDIVSLSGSKPWVAGDLYGYVGSNFLNPENSTAHWDLTVPVISGTSSYPAITPTVFNTNNTSNNVQPFTSTSNNAYAATVGQVFNYGFSGTETLYGAYCYATLKNDPRTFLRTAGSALATSTNYPSHKTIGIRSSLHEVATSSGSLINGNYIVVTKTLLGEGSGVHTFDTSMGSDLTQQSIEQTPSYQLNKIYTIFDRPITYAFNTGLNYLLSFEFYDPDTNGKVGDYAYQYRPLQFEKLYSSLTVGVEDQTPPNYSGAMVVDYYSNGTFYQPSGLYGNIYSSMNTDLTCGLINLLSGSWINGIYDFKIGGDRVSKIVYGQGPYVRNFELSSPNKAGHVQIFSSGSNLEDALWNSVTYDDMMFSHQYSQISGVCWDQVYVNGSGYNSMQNHGWRPEFSAAMISGTGGGTIESGPVQIFIATQMGTGGFRASEVKTIILSGYQKSYIQIAPPNNTNFWPNNTATLEKNSMMESGAYPIVSQYAYDVYGGTSGNATYVFATQPSGSIFYLASMVSVPAPNSAFFAVRPNPLPNVNTFRNVDQQYNTFLSGFTPSILTEQIPAVLALPQNYFLSQTDTPKFKKMQVFYDYILGIGDPNFNSRLWYSEQYAPQIWGESFNYHGFIDVDKDNGSPLVSMEKLREYMILFKKNATYRLEFLGSASQPFSISQVSSKIGSLGAFGTITVGDTIYGLSQYGVFACNGSQVQIISNSIKPFYDDLDHADLTFAVALHDMNHTTIVWSITNNTNSPDATLGIVFDYKAGSFSVRKGSMWNIAATVEDEDGFDVLLGGTSDGQIQVLESRESQVDVFFNDGEGYESVRDIEFIAETPWLSIDDSQSQKQIKHIDINTNKVDTTLGVEVFFDQDEDTVQYARTIDVNVKGSDKRVTLGNQCKTLKLKFYNIGNSPILKINNISIYYIPLGHNLPS